MQHEIEDDIHLGQMVNLFESIIKVRSIDQSASDFSKADEKLENIKCLIYKGKYDENAARYARGTLKLGYQVMIYNG